MDRRERRSVGCFWEWLCLLLQKCLLLLSLLKVLCNSLEVLSDLAAFIYERRGVKLLGLVPLRAVLPVRINGLRQFVHRQPAGNRLLFAYGLQLSPLHE